ncbi:hypothetical protein [Seinonella peptonophila]|uniref:hypothetical protein n=1 Tax=Seinonella peptonophila TaxID=112248 RepID=UPI0015870601|nr:hypothetical protein [Seinonella peptonophila]
MGRREKSEQKVKEARDKYLQTGKQEDLEAVQEATKEFTETMREITGTDSD